MSNNIFSENFDAFDKNFKLEDLTEAQRRFRELEVRKEAMEKHPAGAKTAKTNSSELSDEAKTFVGAGIFNFFFVTIPLALLFAGLAVQPLFEAAWGIDLGFWTAFFVLAALRWLIPRPSKRILVEKFSSRKGR